MTDSILDQTDIEGVVACGKALEDMPDTMQHSGRGLHKQLLDEKTDWAMVVAAVLTTLSYAGAFFLGAWMF